jgi:hypothetical protein
MHADVVGSRLMDVEGALRATNRNMMATEVATDILWSRSPAFTRPGARAGLWLAGAGNLAMALGFGWLARRRPRRRHSLLRR